MMVWERSWNNLNRITLADDEKMSGSVGRALTGPEKQEDSEVPAREEVDEAARGKGEWGENKRAE